MRKGQTEVVPRNLRPLSKDGGCFFLDKPMDVLREFPVRKSKKQKQAFREAVHSYGERLGYPVTEEKAPFGARNILFGDPDKADFLVTAHYDTPARLPFPNFITPKNIVVYLLYQITVAFLLLVPCFAMSMIVGMFAENPIWMMLTLHITMFALLWLMMAGPANKTNANDNTSGVITVLETMAVLPQDLRDKVCFVLFDLEEAGLIGSMSYHSKHKKGECIGYHGAAHHKINTAQARQTIARHYGVRQQCI